VLKTVHASDITPDVERLFSAIQSVQIATNNAAGQAEISYTPYLRVGELFYIFISELAAHTQNLKLSSHNIPPQTSLLFIEDEQQCSNIFARTRLSLSCHAVFIERDTPLWQTTLDKFELSLGKTVALLRSLPDFHLVELRPKQGSFIKGFGQAFRFEDLNFMAANAVTGK